MHAEMSVIVRHHRRGHALAVAILLNVCEVLLLPARYQIMRQTFSVYIYIGLAVAILLNVCQVVLLPSRNQTMLEMLLNLYMI